MISPNLLVAWAWLSLGVLDLAAATRDDDPTAHAAPPIESVLRRWAGAMRVDQPREVHFKWYAYDEAFLIEKRGRGTFALDSQDRGRLVIRPEELAVDAVSAHSRDAVPFSLKSSASESFYWSNERLYTLDDETESAYCFPRKEGAWVFGLTPPPPDACLPLMFNVDADELIERLEWTYGPKTNATVFHLVARRRGNSTPSNHVRWLQRADTQDPLQLFERAEILIDRRTHRTHALRLFHANTESLCIVEKDVLLGAEATEFWQPDLTGFRLIDDACR